MKKLVPSGTCATLVLGCLLFLPSVSADEGVVVLADAPRQLVTTDTNYVVRTATSGTEYPISTYPQFAFDCSRTEGWTIDGNNRVSKVPDLGGGSRYVTSVIAEINHENYKSGSIGLWYSNWQKINAPTLKPADGTIKGPYLDFGQPGSFSCLFFDPSFKVETGGETKYWNKLANVGTVIGVYKPYTGTCATYPAVGDQVMGGQLLGGKDFIRYGKATTLGIGNGEPILFRDVDSPNKSCAAVKKGGTLYKDRQKYDAANGFAFWNPGWEVVAFNPADAVTLETHGIGVGDCFGCDYSRTCGGQAIAELMIFDKVLPDADVKALIAYLDKKWLGHRHDGEEGAGRVAALTLSDTDTNPGVGRIATVNVPSGETLNIDKVRGGRADSAKTLPAVVKTGGGVLSVNDAADFGGEVKLEEGTLAFSSKPVPAFEDLPKGMTFRLDASDTSAMVVTADGTVSEWTNSLWSSRQVRAYQTLDYRRPKLVPDGLGEGLNILDFGSRSEGTQAYFFLDKVVYAGTVFAVVDARIQGGGSLAQNIDRKENWLGRDRRYTELFFRSSAVRSTAQAWVNGRHNDIETEAYEVPAFQVLAMRLPPNATAPLYLGTRTSDTSSSPADGGGLRLGEFIAYERTLTEEEIRDVSAYLMKKWFNRTAPGYENVSGTDVADLQHVTAAAQTVIDVPAGATKTIASLKTTGAVVKTGAGRLLIGNGSDLAGGLIVREGSVGQTAGASVKADSPAKDPILHLDATKADSYYSWLHSGTNYVSAWQSPDGRSGAYTWRTEYPRIPFLNTVDTLNGHPVIDFGVQVDDYSTTKGAYLDVSPEVRNLRAAYVVYGSQAKGGQIFGSQGATVYDMGRDTSPTLETGLFNAAHKDFLEGEIYTNGVLIARDMRHKFTPTGGYQLIEVHPVSGMRFNALSTGGTPNYLHGGNRMGEVIVYERPLTEREKVATRNYLLKKWFPETPLAELPEEPTVAPIPGDFAVAANGTWDVAVKPDGTADAMAVAGTVVFGAGSAISLSGLSAFTPERLRSLRPVIARAGAYDGLADVKVMGDIGFTKDTEPHVVVRANGDLEIRFGWQGLMLIVR